MTYVLVLLFAISGQGVVLPGSYASELACEQAAAGYTLPENVNWDCVIE